MGIAEFLMYFIVVGPIGMLLGAKKNRMGAGFVLAMLLGPIGWIIIFLGPDLNAPKSAKCPVCDGIVPIGHAECKHCKNALTWIKGRPFRPSRAT